MESYLKANYNAEHIAQQVLGQDQDPGSITTRARRHWWALTIPGLRHGRAVPRRSLLAWVQARHPATPDLPLIDPATPPGSRTTTPRSPGRPSPCARLPENQLVT